jgi:hypothetical protein
VRAALALTLCLCACSFRDDPLHAREGRTHVLFDSGERPELEPDAGDDQDDDSASPPRRDGGRIVLELDAGAVAELADSGRGSSSSDSGKLEPDAGEQLERDSGADAAPPDRWTAEDRTHCTAACIAAGATGGAPCELPSEPGRRLCCCDP